VAVSTHKQALHAVISLYKEVLKQDLDLKADAVRAKKKPHNITILEMSNIVLSGSPFVKQYNLLVFLKGSDSNLLELFVRSKKNG
jgi:hypothetical protein